MLCAMFEQSLLTMIPVIWYGDTTTNLIMTRVWHKRKTTFLTLTWTFAEPVNLVALVSIFMPHQSRIQVSSGISSD